MKHEDDVALDRRTDGAVGCTVGQLVAALSASIEQMHFQLAADRPVN